MVHHMMENLMRIILRVLDYIYGLMEEDIMDNGNLIKWMVKVNLHGQMVENIQENMFKIKNKDMVHLNGQMVKSIKEIGIMVHNMDQVPITALKDQSERVNGKKEKEFVGLAKKMNLRNMKILKLYDICLLKCIHKFYLIIIVLTNLNLLNNKFKFYIFIPL